MFGTIIGMGLLTGTGAAMGYFFGLAGIGIFIASLGVVYCIVQPKKLALLFKVEMLALRILRSASDSYDNSSRKSEWVTMEELKEKCKLAICGKNGSATDRTDVGRAVEMVVEDFMQKRIIGINPRVQVALLDIHQENGFKEAYRIVRESYQPFPRSIFPWRDRKAKEKWEAKIKAETVSRADIIEWLKENSDGLSLYELISYYGPFDCQREGDNSIAITAKIMPVLEGLMQEGLIIQGDDALYKVTSV